MDATARWDATIELRAWERHHLHLVKGERLLDVGCGLGHAAVALGEDLGASGEVVGIDASTSMLSVAREGANGAVCPVRFSVGDALALDEPDQSFDVARSERTLQWLADPQIAVEELARVLRPGGRVSLIDTDWSTLRLDVGDSTIAALVHDTMRVEQRRPSNVGSRLASGAMMAGRPSSMGAMPARSSATTWTTSNWCSANTPGNASANDRASRFQPTGRHRATAAMRSESRPVPVGDGAGMVRRSTPASSPSSSS